MNRNLGKQFSYEDVEKHVPGAHDQGWNRPDDTFSRRLIPMGKIHERTNYQGSTVTMDVPPEHVEDTYREWDEEGAAGLADSHWDRIDKLAEQPASSARPLVVSPYTAHDGSTQYTREDGYHRIHAVVQQDPSITHAVAYVRHREDGD